MGMLNLWKSAKKGPLHYVIEFFATSNSVSVFVGMRYLSNYIQSSKSWSPLFAFSKKIWIVIIPKNYICNLTDLFVAKKTIVLLFVNDLNAP